MIGIIEKASAVPKQPHSRIEDGPVISANYKARPGVATRELCKALHFRKARFPFRNVAFRMPCTSPGTSGVRGKPRSSLRDLSRRPLDPALERGAKLGRPSGARALVGLGCLVCLKLDCFVIGL